MTPPALLPPSKHVFLAHSPFFSNAPPFPFRSNSRLLCVFMMSFTSIDSSPFFPHQSHSVAALNRPQSLRSSTAKLSTRSKTFCHTELGDEGQNFWSNGLDTMRLRTQPGNPSNPSPTLLLSSASTAKNMVCSIY